MKLIKTRVECLQEIAGWKALGKSIGFVPTMGALHEGHLSLVENSTKENDCTIVSIFVNPTQFNEKNDFKSYPRDLNNDAKILSNLKVNAIFAPDVDEIYPNINKKKYDLGGLEINMEGKHRPGHFQGVAMVIDRLFQIIEADKAYFGEKDFQQLAIIKYLTKKLGFKTKVKGCPIIRDDKGLALSSRNQLLNDECRENAPRIFELLKYSKQEIKNKTIREIKNHVIETLNSIPCFKVEYFEIVDANSLQPVNKIKKEMDIVGCIAVWADKVRLIDNIIYNS